MRITPRPTLLPTLTAVLLLACQACSQTAAAGPATAPTAAPDAADASGASGCPAILRHSFPRLQDEKPQSLCQYAGRVVLVVNTASFCGFTRQYEGLEALDAKYRPRGFVVLGFPSNDFAQETGSNKEIADFCENTFGVKFPMFAKSSVRGAQANALFRELAAQTGAAPRWNFYKYLIGRDGSIVASYPSQTRPDDPRFVRELERQIEAR